MSQRRILTLDEKHGAYEKKSSGKSARNFLKCNPLQFKETLISFNNKQQ